MAQNGHSEYMKTQILTASKERLVLMLYDGMQRFCEQAKAGWKEENLERAHQGLVRAQDILLELLYTLDKEKGGEIADKLAQLYTFCYRHLVEANVQRSASMVEEVQGILRELREAWFQAMEATGAEREAAGEEPAAPAGGQARAPSKPQGTPLAKMPVKKMPVSAENAEDQSQQPRISVQG
jgi:flagellar protein FliS